MSPEWFERGFDADYLEIYAHRDSTEAERGTAALLEPLGLAGRRVLDVGSGAGRWSRAVGSRGARVIGVDLSLTLLQAARAAGSRELVRADMRRLPFRTASFDVVLCMFTTFGYFATAGEDRQALGEMARVLRPGGRVVLDLLNPERARRELVPESHRQASGFEVHETRALDAAGERIFKEVRLRRGDETRHYHEEVRLWEPEALAAALREVLLVPQSRWGDYDARAYHPQHSPRLIQLARRGA
jgi:SAM-dependent methyltransferase